MEKSPQAFTSRETFQAGISDLDDDGDLDANGNPDIVMGRIRCSAEIWLNLGPARDGVQPQREGALSHPHHLVELLARALARCKMI
ncbi:MAG: hypothetical protein JW726_02535 [Anaerolineales bacterium]|nr:hypothetical protein [Anaerolineales bacterium]